MGMIIGYTTGVYDMFHIGHLNIIRRAKEQCDYLIVGVSTDELVQKEKGKTPVIPYEERAAIVKAIRYVDEVVPQTNKDKMAAWERTHFHKMFVGSDWEGSPQWKNFEEQFKPLGVEIIYIPHTDGISSTKLTGVIKHILDDVPNGGGYSLNNATFRSAASIYLSTSDKRAGELMKKYKVGYTTGVYDMFHIGHLNLLKRAKEQCEYLIVGVSTDELVKSYKKKKPIICFEERKAIVEAIKYVDEVVPQVNMNKFGAWEKLHFDVLFHGADWKGSEMYDKIASELEAVGVDLVFLPHTDGISSTLLSQILYEYEEKQQRKDVMRRK